MHQNKVGTHNLQHPRQWLPAIKKTGRSDVPCLLKDDPEVLNSKRMVCHNHATLNFYLLLGRLEA
jgi:hypothetical protein